MKAKKVVSDRLQKVLNLAGYSSARVLTQKRHLNQTVLKIIKTEYEEELIFCGQMFKAADDHEFSVFLPPHDPRWSEVGFSEFCEDEFIFFRRLCEKDGYSVAFTSNGLVVPPRSRETKPSLFALA